MNDVILAYTPPFCYVRCSPGVFLALEKKDGDSQQEHVFQMGVTFIQWIVGGKPWWFVIYVDSLNEWHNSYLWIWTGYIVHHPNCILNDKPFENSAPV